MVSQHFKPIVKMGPKTKLLLFCFGYALVILEAGLLSFIE